MCQHKYCFYSACKHGEFLHLSYCKRAKALGWPERDSHYSPSDTASSDSSDPSDPDESDKPDQPGSAPTHQQDPLIQDRSYTSSSQHHHNMSTVLPRPALKLDTSTDRNAPIPLTQLIPRAVLEQGNTSAINLGSGERSATLDMSGGDNFNIDFPLNDQSSLTMELSHDGKVMELVARFESYVDLDGSDASEETHESRARVSSTATIRPGVTTIENTEKSLRSPNKPRFEPSEETEGETFSPRKPISSQWPNLATAQRARARETKKTSQDDSPVDKKGLRVSPSRGSPHNTRQSALTVKMSPPKTSQLSAGPDHDQPESSRASSVYVSAHNSPDRGRVSGGGGDNLDESQWDRMSFVTAPEKHEDNSPSDIFADNDDSEQAVQTRLTLHSSGSSEPHVNATSSVGKRSSPQKLALKMARHSPVSGPREPPVSPTQPVSRIPRISASSKAKNPVGSSSMSKLTLQRAQSTKTSKPGNGDTDDAKPHQSSLPQTSYATRVRTVDSAGNTPILADFLDKAPLMRDNAEATSTTESNVEEQTTQEASDKKALVESFLKSIPAPDTNIPVSSLERASSSTAATTAPIDTEDAIRTDPAVISRLPKPDASCMLTGPPLIVMMAHITPLGSERSAATPRRSSLPVSSTSPAFISGLRATAAEFVPRTKASTNEVKAETTAAETSIAQTATTEAIPPPNYYNVLGIDPFGSPWIFQWYSMPGVPGVPYSAGCSASRRRSKSPKKNKNKKNASDKTNGGNDTENGQTSGCGHGKFKADENEVKAIAPSKQLSDEPFAMQMAGIDRQRAMSDAAVRGVQGCTMSTSRGGGPDWTPVARITSQAPSNAPQGPRNPRGYNHGTYPRNYRSPANGLYGGRGAGMPMKDTAPFPDPVPPRGPRRRIRGGALDGCGLVNIVSAHEYVGGPPCNTCSPDH